MLYRSIMSLGVFSSLFLIVALYSYQSLDPASLTSSGYQLNQAGFIGAILADFFLLHLGLAAYLLPLSLIYMSHNITKKSPSKTVSALFLVLAPCFYLETYHIAFLNSYSQHLPSTLGGWMGQECKSFFHLWLGPLGSQIFFHIIFIHSLDNVLSGKLFHLAEITISKIAGLSSQLLKRKSGVVESKKESRGFKKVPADTTQKEKTINQDSGVWKEQAEKLSSQLAKYGIENKVTAIVPGPVVIRFELQLAAGERSSKVVTLAKDLARSLLVSHLNVIENIPGSSSIGVEIPQSRREVIELPPLLSQVSRSMKLPLVLGVQTQCEPVIVDLVKLPHLLVAGSTGSGKSVGIASMLLSLIEHHDTDLLRLILIDPKVLEFSRYENLKHLALPIISDHEQALAALLWCVDLMESRYHLMAKHKVRNIVDYHQKLREDQQLPKMPYMVVIIDELADLMMLSKKAVEEPIARLAQKARACGIHLVIATQRPSVDIITGLIKANVPARLSYAVSSKIDSRTILDQSGGESLLGMGDAYFIMPGYPHLQRVHGAYVSDRQIDEVVEKHKVAKPDYFSDLKVLLEAMKQEL